MKKQLLLTTVLVLSNTFPIHTTDSEAQQRTLSANINQSGSIMVIHDPNLPKENSTQGQCPIFGLFMAPKNVSCFGGSDGRIRANAFGNYGPYTIRMIGIGFDQTQIQQVPGEELLFSGLKTGYYSAIVTDIFGCSTEFLPIAFIDTPSAITFEFTTQAASCSDFSDGKITITSVAGGVTPYQRASVSTALGSQTKPFTGLPLEFSGLKAGSYVINVVDNNDCTATNYAIIGAPTPLVPTFTIQHLCPSKKGSLTVTAITGGVAPYRVKIDNDKEKNFTGKPITFPGLSVGSHTLTVTDSTGCTNTTLTSINPCLSAAVGRPKRSSLY